MNTTTTMPVREPLDTPADPQLRYLELDDLVDGLVAAFTRSDDDTEDARILATLAEATAELATLSSSVHHPVTEHELIAADRDDARLAALLADVAATRAHRTPRTVTVPELEAHPYVRAVLEQMAGQIDQPGWVLAHRINVLIDHADFAGLDTRLAQRLALAVSRRPDGENAAEHEAADDQLARAAQAA
ncbi:hypothetical protein [Amycolatopsis australiensis]|uniref:Uncharacterized protein n=1 Tax=Amycolatopsis australiensis TaxID=546364 RepID=A0A1K1LLI5_9PSEU|nr:hypothetical protein [Amycolatopsis australiensis]SFW11711.1 hypothetical protein SAMN04489730_0050 [Amycolatopsis australiensis]